MQNKTSRTCKLFTKMLYLVKGTCRVHQSFKYENKETCRNSLLLKGSIVYMNS